MKTKLNPTAYKDKESEINRRLAQLSPDYSISNLRLQPNGKFAFDLRCAFAPQDLDEIKKVFQSVLAGFERNGQKIQTKVYLSPKAHQKLKRLAYSRKTSQSAIVEQCIMANLQTKSRKSKTI
jgi:hypothetical protein